jgi:D-lactate dehydrogenase
MINTSRGEIIDTNALFEGIENGIIVGAGIDSFENEQEVIYTTLIGFVIQLLIELIKKK